MATTLYWVIDTAAAIGTPTGSQVVAGQNGSGVAAVASGSEAYTSAGTYTEATPPTTLSAGTSYNVAWVAYDGSTYSTVVISDATYTSNTVFPAVGGIVVAGYAPGISQPHTVAPSTGAYTAAGNAPTISQPRSISPGAGAYDILGYAPTVSQSVLITPESGAISVSGYAPTISQPRTIAPGAGALEWLGYAPSISQEAVTLTQADLDAIAAAVWADPVAVAAHAKLDAIIARITC